VSGDATTTLGLVWTAPCLSVELDQPPRISALPEHLLPEVRKRACDVWLQLDRGMGLALSVSIPRIQDLES